MSTCNNDKHFNFWVKYLKIISLFFAAVGVMWAVIGSFDPLGIYEKNFAQAFWNTDTLPTDARRTFRFILGPFGATSAGYFALQFFIAKYAYAHKLLWGYNAIVTAFSIWFILDTSISLLYKAYFNIVMANLPSLLFMLPVFFTKKYFSS